MKLPDLMRPFAIAIHAKAKVLNDPRLQPAHRSRLRESISDDIKKASNFHVPRQSTRARAKSQKLRPSVELGEETWHTQHRFDPGRAVFILEHRVTVSTLREECIAQTSRRAVLQILTERLEVVWILREEDERLTGLKYRTRRPATAYDDAKSKIWEGA